MNGPFWQPGSASFCGTGFTLRPRQGAGAGEIRERSATQRVAQAVQRGRANGAAPASLGWE
jgi:hypothetical protein